MREYQKYPTGSFPCPTCSACGRRVYLSTPPVSPWFLLAPAAVCLLIVLSALTPWKWLMVPWMFLIWPSCFLGSYLRGKRRRFVRALEDLRELRWHRVRLTAAQGMNLKKRLLTNGCFHLQADLPDEARELAVLVEPSAAADGEVRLAFLDPTKGRDFSGVDFWLKDGNERICIGCFL